MGIKLGLIVRNSGADAARQVAEVPPLAEDLGFDSIWVSDHVSVPPEFARRYDEHWLEASVALASAAAHTTRIRVGFSALILPYRPASIAAAQVAALFELSGGRLVVGAGSGWLRQEFDALGLDFASRGRATDETILEIKSRCNVEILAAGNGTRVLERAASLCSGWHPIALSPAEVAARKAALDRLAGRPMHVTLRTRFSIQPQNEQRPLYGTPEKIRFDIEKYAASGVDEIVLDYAVRSHGEILDGVRAFAADVGFFEGDPQ